MELMLMVADDLLRALCEFRKESDIKQNISGKWSFASLFENRLIPATWSRSGEIAWSIFIKNLIHESRSAVICVRTRCLISFAAYKSNQQENNAPRDAAHIKGISHSRHWRGCVKKSPPSMAKSENNSYESRAWDIFGRQSHWNRLTP